MCDATEDGDYKEEDHLSLLIAELKIHDLYSLITTNNDFDNADPNSMGDVCYI